MYQFCANKYIASQFAPDVIYCKNPDVFLGCNISKHLWCPAVWPSGMNYNCR